MNRDTFRAMQAPVKQLFVEHPERAAVVLRAEGEVDPERIGCRVRLLANDGRDILAGLHPAAGGDGLAACSGELLLQALVTCAGTTLAAVAKALGLNLQSAIVTATGHMDFRGTLGVDRSVPTGLTDVQLGFHLQGDIPAESQRKLLELTERCCVVLQTLEGGVPLRSSVIE
ncbi:MAG: hypothetical protein RLZZ436_355 [Planctomycetota bacterium]